MLNNLVVSLETAKKLKAAGWVKPTLSCGFGAKRMGI